MEFARISSRWPRFTLRELMFAMLALCFAFGWYREFKIAEPIRSAVNELDNRPEHPFGQIKYSEYKGVKFTVMAGTETFWAAEYRNRDDPWKNLHPIRPPATR